MSAPLRRVRFPQARGYVLRGVSAGVVIAEDDDLLGAASQQQMASDIATGLYRALPRDIRRGDPLRQCFAASSLALGVTACLKLRDCALLMQRHSLSPSRHERSMLMGFPIIIRYRIGLKPSPRQAAAGARRCR